MRINSWRAMWVLAVYDTPVTTSEGRRAYTRFRKTLLRNNFVQHQFSVYLRHCPTIAIAHALIHRVKNAIPEGAHVAFFFLTDKQYGMTQEFWGLTHTKKKPVTPCQVELF
jgi:CRISPR-associated protein Cas2